MEMQRNDTESSRSTATSGFRSRLTSPSGDGLFTRTPDTDLASPPYQISYDFGTRDSYLMAQGGSSRPPISYTSTPAPSKRVMDLTELPPAKKRKLAASSAGSARSARLPSPSLPMGMWIMVMQFLSPFDLGALLQVDRSFYDCLVPRNASLFSSSSVSKNDHDPDRIWTASRKFYYPHLPAPPPKFLEIEIWKLLFSKRCQLCKFPSGDENRFLAQGLLPPGDTDVDIIWSFGIRSCRSCLRDRTVEEQDLPPPPFSEYWRVMSHIQATQDLSAISESVPDGYCDQNFPLTLYLQDDVKSVFDSYRVPLSQGPATVNNWFATTLRKANVRRASLGNWRRLWLEGAITIPKRRAHSSLEQHNLVGVQPSYNSRDGEGVHYRWESDDDFASLPGQDSLIEPTDAREDQGELVDIRHEPSGYHPSLGFISRTPTASSMKWDESEDPINQCLAQLSDKIIQEAWDGGKAVTQESCSRFAVNILVRVREEFEATWGEDSWIGDNAELYRQRSKTPPADPKLTLQNMKWLYNNKIKSLVEKYDMKLPFRCSAGSCKTRRKPFSLEGIILHFGSKHTVTFTNGKKTVDWEYADWPLDPPFVPRDSISIPGYHQSSPSVYSPRNSPQTISSTTSPFSHHVNMAETAFRQYPGLSASPTVMYGTPNQSHIHESFRQQTPIAPAGQPLLGVYPQAFTQALHIPGIDHDYRHAIDPEEEDENSNLNRRRRYAWAQQIIAEENSRLSLLAQSPSVPSFPAHGESFGYVNGPAYPHASFQSNPIQPSPLIQNPPLPAGFGHSSQGHPAPPGFAPYKGHSDPQGFGPNGPPPPHPQLYNSIPPLYVAPAVHPNHQHPHMG